MGGALRCRFRRLRVHPADIILYPHVEDPAFGRVVRPLDEAGGAICGITHGQGGAMNP